jgi:hypothetical protein
VITPGSTGAPTKVVRTVGTMADDLVQPADRFMVNAETHGVMARTCLHWNPIEKRSEGQFALSP